MSASRIVSSIVFASCLFVGKGVLADVIFARDGQDLLVTIDREYEFEVTADANRPRYGVIFHDVYSVAPTDFAVTTPAVHTSEMQIDSQFTASVAYGGWGQLGFERNAVDANDFWGIYAFGTNRLLRVGDEVAITAGLVTVEDYFDNPDAVLPDQSTGFLQLTDDLGRALSLGDAAAVPEPRTTVLLMLFSVGIVVRRARRQPTSDCKPS